MDKEKAKKLDLSGKYRDSRWMFCAMYWGKKLSKTG